MAILAMNIVCTARDLLVLSRTLHKDLLTPHANGQKLDTDFLFSHIVFAMEQFNSKVVGLDRMLNKAPAFQLERQGWVLSQPVALTRAWRVCVSAIGGRMQQAVLEQFNTTLDVANKEVRASCPDWRAAFLSAARSTCPSSTPS